MAVARAERRALRRAFDIVADDGDTDDPVVIGDEPVPAGHRVVEGAEPRDKLVCSCGQIFATAAGFHQHTRPPAESPGPVPPPAGAAAVDAATRPPETAPAGPGPRTYKSRKPRPGDDNPPADFYDNLPEARNLR